MSDAAPRLLVLGAGRASVPTLQALKGRGCRLAVLDGMPQAPAFRLADAGILASTFDVEATVEAARAYAARTRIDAVLGTARRVSTAVAMVADALGLPGVSCAAAACAADRLAMKRRLRDAGIAVPWSAVACGPAALRQIAAASTQTLVVKPVDGWAARGVVRLLDGIDVAWAHRVAVLSSPSGRAMVEAYVAGRQLSVVSLVLGAEVVTIDVAERATDAHDRFAPFVIDAGHVCPATLSAAERGQVDTLVRATVAALALGDGVVTSEVVLSAQGAIMLDVELGLVDGRRLAHEIPLATGIDVIGAALQVATGEPPGVQQIAPRWLRPVAERAVFTDPGTVVAVRDAEAAAREDGVTLVDLLVAPGGRVLPPTSNLCHGGAVVATGESREQAVARATAAASRISIVTTGARASGPGGH